MAIIKKMNGLATYTIESKDGHSRATFIPAKGGIGSSLVMQDGKGERELLYLHDFFWQQEIPDLPGGWPFCFPICARLERMGKLGNYLYDGRIYNMPIHGFGWWLPWEVSSHKSNEITLNLSDSPTTRKMYPFKFNVKLNYKISDNLLLCYQTYTNNSDYDMPYHAGFHPYFLTPMTIKKKIKLHYHPIRHFRYNERLTDLIGEVKLFELPTLITNPEINEQLTQVGKDKAIQFIYPDNFTLVMEANGIEDPNLFSYVQLYTIPEKPFFCVEPWMSFPNALNTVIGVRWLKPGQSENGLLTLTGIK